MYHFTTAAAAVTVITTPPGSLLCPERLFADLTTTERQEQHLSHDRHAHFFSVHFYYCIMPPTRKP